MSNSINYKDTLFKRENLTPICGEPTFEIIHNLRNEIEANTKSIYFNLGVISHGHPSLVLTNAQHALISNIPFVYLTHLGTFIIPDGTTDHMKSNMQIAHTEEMRFFCEVTGVEQSLVQHNFCHS